MDNQNPGRADGAGFERRGRDLYVGQWFAHFEHEIAGGILNKHGCLAPTPRHYLIGLGTGMFTILLGGFVSGLEPPYQSPRMEWLKKREISSLTVLEVEQSEISLTKNKVSAGPAPSTGSR